MFVKVDGSVNYVVDICLFEMVYVLIVEGLMGDVWLKGIDKVVV